MMLYISMNTMENVIKIAQKDIIYIMILNIVNAKEINVIIAHQLQ